MSLFTALYNLLIGPLELFFEVLFSVVNRIVGHPGLSIVFLSLAMNFLVLPLYKMSDAMQAEEAATEAKLKPTVTHIKKTFKGDERFMILQMYYKENHYKPSDALKGSVSLLLEIPFFMAAYNFLSNLPILHGASFGPIANLAAPDAMLVIGGIAINVLPILMTVINLVSSAIYTKGASTRSKVQLYVMAGLFLVLLYDSPAGLVFYWTLNNLFSLVKNIFMKLKNPKKVFCGLCAVLGIFLIASGCYIRRIRELLILGGVILQLPLGILLLGKRFPLPPAAPMEKKDRQTFWIGALFLTVLTGLYIPAGVIRSSPEEFMNPVTFTSPLLYILSASLTAAGFFLIWFGVFYLLARNSGRKWMSYGVCAVSFIACIDFIFFGSYGTMSPNLVFDAYPAFKGKLFNLLVVLALAAAVYLFWKKKQVAVRRVLLSTAVAIAATSCLNMIHIQTTVSEKYQQMAENTEDAASIPLSRNGKNVIVLMLDRGIGAYVPYIMNEKPELREQFAGFTYYPNTISYGGHTNFGAPALFGGYEYTPEELNRRDGEPLESKHNEALLVMPVLFSQNGFETTVCDPPYAGYDWIPDLTIYDAYPQIRTFNSMGQYSQAHDPYSSANRAEAVRNRNFFCYSIFRIAPVAAQSPLYNKGHYNASGAPASQQVSGPSRAEGIDPKFTRAYTVLADLPSLTGISEDGGNTFLMLTNDTAHEPTLLQKPGYEIADFVDNTAYDQAHRDLYTLDGLTLNMGSPSQAKHYHANMAAYLKLGEWFDYLRAEGVYDNTRIILVADHGSAVHSLDAMHMDAPEREDLIGYNPVLMVKDFGSTEFTTDPTFMTNADTPSLALEGLVDDPVNPFTGLPVTMDEKLAHPQHILCSHIWKTEKNNGNTFLPGPWLSVHDDIFDLNNWEYLGEK